MMECKNLHNHYDDSDIRKQIDFNLRKSGRGYDENSKMLISLLNERAKTRMISVSEYLPEELHHAGGDSMYSDLVLTYTRDGMFGLGRVIDGEFADALITHWMPLPPPPEDANED